MSDPDGEFANFLIGAAIGLSSVYVGDIIENIATGKSGLDILKPTSSLGNYVSAGVSGMIPGAGFASMAGRSLAGAAAKQGVSYLQKGSISSEGFLKDSFTGMAGEILVLGSSKALSKASPKNYSSFKNSLTKRYPTITKAQTQKRLQLEYKAYGYAQRITAYNVNLAMSRF